MSEREESVSEKTPIWWGTFELSEGAVGCWRVGPLAFCAKRLAQEWRLAYHRYEDEAPTAVNVPCGSEETDEIVAAGSLLRAASRQLGEAMVVTPALADRPVVARPEPTLKILAGAEIELYVSTPVWLQIYVKGIEEALLDVPSQRPSDTWLGASTRAGELCYAIRTKARLDLENLPLRAYRAITKILLRNRAADTLILERLSLPFPHLSIYRDRHGYLWTQRLTVARSKTGSLAEVHLGEGPPREAEEAEVVAGPRDEPSKNVLNRALGALFG